MKAETPRTLYAWDYLIGVQDLTRPRCITAAARRGREPLPSPINPRSAPTQWASPSRNLRQWQGKSRRKRLDDLDALRGWLAVLVAPGRLFGWCEDLRPISRTPIKASGLRSFPAKDDERDIGAWESPRATVLPQRTGIDVPPARTKTFRRRIPHLLREALRPRRYNRRRFLCIRDGYACERIKAKGTSYLDMAEFLHHRGAKQYVEADLEQLFRRVAFNVAIGNRG